MELVNKKLRTIKGKVRIHTKVVFVKGGATFVREQDEFVVAFGLIELKRGIKRVRLLRGVSTIGPSAILERTLQHRRATVAAHQDLDQSCVPSRSSGN